MLLDAGGTAADAARRPDGQLRSFLYGTGLTGRGSVDPEHRRRHDLRQVVRDLHGLCGWADDSAPILVSYDVDGLDVDLGAAELTRAVCRPATVSGQCRVGTYSSSCMRPSKVRDLTSSRSRSGQSAKMGWRPVWPVTTGKTTS